MSLFDFGEGAVFRLETYISTLHFFENRSYFREKASGTSAVTAVIYSGNAQSLNGLARDLLASRTLYQSCHLCAIRVVISMIYGRRLADCFPFQQIVSY